MPILAVSNVGKIGIVRDMAAHELPFEAWSNGNNVRFASNFAEKIKGWQAVFGTPPVAFLNGLYVPSQTNPYWLLFGLQKAYISDGATYTNVTRQTAGVDVNYTGSVDTPWRGGVLGGIPVMTNGSDVPQFFAPVDITTKMRDLTNWPTGVTCKVIRPFKQYLVALGITKSSVKYPYMVKWSHPAAPGTVPATWDETDPTYDAGEYDFSEDVGDVLDAVSLRDILVIYREGSVWGMQAVADANIFRFFRMFNSFGALSVDCATEYVAGKHLVFSSNDILVHDGQNAQSILQDRDRDEVFSSIDRDQYRRSFVVRKLAKNEVWCCYPTTGSSWPNRAVIWNWSTNAISFRDLPDLTSVSVGLIPENASKFTWAENVTWEADAGSWDAKEFNPVEEQLLGVSYGNSLVYNMETTELFGANAFSAWLERTGLGVPFKQGQPPDMSSIKFLRNVWPRITGTAGLTVKVTVGAQMEVGGNIAWEQPQDYIIGETQKIDCLVSGRLFAIRFSSDTALTWRLHGYELDASFGGHW